MNGGSEEWSGGCGRRGEKPWGLMVSRLGSCGDTSALRVDHDTIIAPGQRWACAAGSGGIVGSQGQELAAGSGTVSAPPP